MFNIIEETRKEYKDYFYTIDTYPQMYEVNVWSYTDDDFHYKSKFICDDLEDVIYSIEYYLDEQENNMDKVICNMCMKTFKDDDELKLMEDQDGYFKGCPTCKTDSYLMDLED